MPRRPLSPQAQKALAYWGVIELAAEVHASTADLWSWIRDSATDLGRATPGVTVQGVSQLRGMAGEIRERSRQFNDLTDSRRVRAAHVSEPPWARTRAEQRALPRWAVRFQHTFIQDGVEITQWRTSMFPGKINHTAGQVRELIELDALNMAKKYNTAHTGISDLQIMVV